jgi:hypothetical protein
VGEVGAALVRTREGVSASRIPEPREREGILLPRAGISTISNHGGGLLFPYVAFRLDRHSAMMVACVERTVFRFPEELARLVIENFWTNGLRHREGARPVRGRGGESARAWSCCMVQPRS